MSEEAASHDVRILTTVVEVTQDQIDKNKGQYAVTLGDVVKDSYYEVMNPELHLFAVTKPFKRQIDLRVAIGRGYVPSERHDLQDQIADEILIDASFSPVRLVNYFVENTRVGQDTDFDRLILEVHTDGRVSPTEVLGFASQIGLKHFEVFGELQPHALTFDEGATAADRSRGPCPYA